MALSFSNCLTPQPGVNEMYGNCCCDLQCLVTTDSATTIDDIVSFFGMESFILSSIKAYDMSSNILTPPFSLNANDTFYLEMTICAPEAGNSDQLDLNFIFGEGGSQKISFDFQSIDLSTSVSPSSFSFGNTVVNSTKTLGFQIQSPALCCQVFNISTDCPDVIITPPSVYLCTGEKDSSLKIDWTPLALGALSCIVTVSNDCQTYDFPVTGNAINPPSGGGERIEQKNKVDQTTRVEPCSPRSANNRCQTAQSMQNAIRTNARRFGKR
jgi:hypothetical protein